MVTQVKDSEWWTWLLAGKRENWLLEVESLGSVIDLMQWKEGKRYYG